MLKIYHNPRCSKSRTVLALVEQFGRREGVEVEVIEYLKQPPTPDELARLKDVLGVRAMVRDSEERYISLQLAQADDAALLAAVARYPELLQRPIVCHGNRAIVARPPELLEAFLALR